MTQNMITLTHEGQVIENIDITNEGTYLEGTLNLKSALATLLNNAKELKEGIVSELKTSGDSNGLGVFDTSNGFFVNALLVVNEEKPEVDFRLSVSILPSNHLLGLMHEDTEEEAFEDLLDDSANFIALVDSQATYNTETGVVEIEDGFYSEGVKDIFLPYLLPTLRQLVETYDTTVEPLEVK